MNLRALQRPGALAALRFVPSVVAGLQLAWTSATTPLPPLARGAAIGLLVLSMLLATLPKRDNVKTHGAFIFAVIAVAITGLTRTGPAYPVGCAVFLVVALGCLRAPILAARMRASDEASPEFLDDRRPPTARAWRTASTRTRVVLAVVTVVVAGAFIRALPPAGAFAERQIQRYAGNAAIEDDDRIGFATNIRVGSLRHVLKSDRVLMRIEGEAPELLRGVVLETYDRHVWSSTRDASTTIVATTGSRERATTRIELSRAALGGRVTEPRWFLPADACDVRTPSGQMSVDSHGTARPVPQNNARDISFSQASRGPCSNRLPEPAPPSSIELAMESNVRRELAPMAYRWVQDSKTKQEALTRIVAQLQTFEYSLAEHRETARDPVVEFLTVEHRGHCEHFASGMALLARAVGIPARVVVGFRVDEVNELTGLAVVRDRNAHSWVEAWIGNRWMTFDPTPLSELHATTRPTRWEQLTEAFSLVWDRTLGFFARLTLLSLGVLFALAAVALVILRAILQRNKKATRATHSFSRPLPAFETLSVALENAGFVRAASEPLERFAKRVSSAGEAWSDDVAEILQVYAKLRYGGLGEVQSVSTRLEALARKIGPTPK